MPYADLREYISVLESKGLFKWVDAEVDKDWEVSCVLRLAFRGLPESDRPALGFRNVKGFKQRIVAGAVGGSRRILALGLQTDPRPIAVVEKLAEAERNPIGPVRVKIGPVKEIVRKGKEASLHELPIPVWTPEKDAGPYLTPLVVTKDPETGVENVAVYRSQLKGERKLGLQWHPYRGGYMNSAKWESRGESTPVAIVLGSDPSVYYAAISRIPHGLGEFSVAGGIRGTPLELVRCETIDLEVPSTAEIVIEGTIPKGASEEEGPFGEYTGYEAYARSQPFMEVTCITMRKDAILQGLISQLRPSESGVLNSTVLEGNLYKHLKHDLKMSYVKQIHITDGSWIWVSLESPNPGRLQDVFHAIAGRAGVANYKYVVAVDDDVNISDPWTREWILSFRTRPEEDIFVTPKTWPISLDPSAAPAYAGAETHTQMTGKAFIDATKKYKPFPEIALPKKELLLKVLSQWDKYNLPKLTSFYAKSVEETLPYS